MTSVLSLQQRRHKKTLFSFFFQHRFLYILQHAFANKVGFPLFEGEEIDLKVAFRFYTCGNIHETQPSCVLLRCRIDPPFKLTKSIEQRKRKKWYIFWRAKTTKATTLFSSFSFCGQENKMPRSIFFSFMPPFLFSCADKVKEEEGL